MRTTILHYVITYYTSVNPILIDSLSLVGFSLRLHLLFPSNTILFVSTFLSPAVPDDSGVPRV
ncbi:MAG: hypothetical protein ACK559_09170, partial [bacterium]